MRQYNCIIIEDEPLAAEVLEDYIREIPYLNLVASYDNAIRAMEGLNSVQVDLIFLDIHLPKVPGIEFLKTLKTSPHVIITTAYQQYALDSYEYNVVDYLLKPVSFPRFLKSLNKLKFLNSERTNASALILPGDEDHLFVNSDKKKVKVSFREIIYIESMKEYIRIVTRDKEIITKFQLGEIETYLPKIDFVRIHRSYIVARQKIGAYNNTSVEIGDKTLPIGRSYKELVMNLMRGNN